MLADRPPEASPAWIDRLSFPALIAVAATLGMVMTALIFGIAYGALALR